jgi:hypothetical protein
MIRGYITKRPNGLYVVTKFLPVICKISFTEKHDVYITYGDPAGFLNISQHFADSVYGDLQTETLQPRRMWLIGKGKYTHWLLRSSNGLYEIRQQDNITNRITNVCPWFVSKVFNIQDLSQDNPILIHFSGELI